MDRDEETDPLIGREIANRYRIEHKLGAGAMGAVYRARHIKVGRSFAVKVLHDRALSDEKVAQRFQREAELAGKLHHINVVGVVDVGETDDGIHFMVMEYADGPTLGSLIDGPMDPERVIDLVRQMLDGLEHAHGHGLVHRDFKPDNVIVELARSGNERPRIVDFGIAILRDQASQPGRADRLTTAGLVLGTPHYMAPEHAMGEGVDHRIDLFALGVIVYEMLTGRLPYDGDGVDVARANLLHATPPMGIRVPTVTVDPLLEAFTRRLMEKKPDDRPESAKAARALLDLIVKDRRAAAAALYVELSSANSTPPVPMAPAPAIALPPPSRQEHPTDKLGGSNTKRIAAIAGLVTVAVIAIVVLATRGETTTTDANDRPPTVATAIPDAGGLELPIDATVAAATDAPSPIVEPPPPPPTTTTTKTPKPRQKPAVINKPVAPVVVDTSANAVATLYGAVGRELKALDTRKGSGATSALWPRYLRIRINDMLTTPERRAEAQRTLAQLRAEIAAL